LSIKITTCQRASRITHNDAVGIEHRHKFKDEFMTKFFGDVRIAGNEIHEALHHPRGWRFAGMNSGGNDDGFLLLFKLKTKKK
jgi:hypothetical protein